MKLLTILAETKVTEEIIAFLVKAGYDIEQDVEDNHVIIVVGEK